MQEFDLFTRLSGTLAVILVVAAVIGGSSLNAKFGAEKKDWKYMVIAGLLGGLFGIYGNISGWEYHGAVVSVRDIGPMMAGFMGGPLGGLIGGVIAGGHRLLMGGVTAAACVVATSCIGLFCGFLARSFRKIVTKPWWAFLVGAAMEVFHLAVVLLMVKPFETAWDIVRRIWLPFIIINALGFTLMIFIMDFIERQQSMIQEKARIQGDLKTATTIQHSLLPPITDQYPGRQEIELAAEMDPAREVGGDFYDFFFVDPDHFAFLIADVSGKSIPGALFMVRSKQVLQSCVREITPLAEAIATANSSLCESNEAEMFVTAWIGILELSTGKLSYVNAGHNPPVLISAGEGNWLKRRGGFVLGGMPGIPFKEESLSLKPGDRLFLYTDGVPEAEDENHTLYGEERLMRRLLSQKSDSVREEIDGIAADIEAHVKGFEQFDDITMLCLEYNGAQG